MIGVLIRRGKFGDRNTEGRHKEEGRVKMETADWSDATKSQSTTRIAGNHQTPGETCGLDSPSEPLKGTNVANILISGFWNSERLNFYCFKLSLCDNLLQQPWETNTDTYQLCDLENVN